MKEQVQGLIDDLLKEHKESGMISTYLGVPLSEFTKEELIAIVHQMGQEQNSMRKQHSRDINFMADKGGCGMLTKIPIED